MASANKYLLFEYLVYLLVKWGKEVRNEDKLDLSKLRLQKILFFVATIKSEENNHKLLDIFDNFYALPYGPVEIDIYDAMNNNAFSSIKFEGNACVYDSLSDDNFISLSKGNKQMLEESVDLLMGKDFNYLSAPVFKLVEITHKWTVWEVSMKVADLLGAHRERMATTDICRSKIKAFE